MNYFKINDIDFSHYVNKLEVKTVHNHKQQTNALGDINAKYINTKKVIDVGIIPLDAESNAALLAQINKFKVSVSFLNPETRELETIDCIIPDNTVDYYTIRADKVSLKAYSLSFTQI